jgi:hypothetical protein
LISAELVLFVGWLVFTGLAELQPVEVDCVIVAGCVDRTFGAGAELTGPAALPLDVAGTV